MQLRQSGESGTVLENFSRRTVLRAAAGTTAIGVTGIAAAGSVSAECDPGSDEDPEIVFCGCTQVCWCVPYCNIVRVITEKEELVFTERCDDLVDEDGDGLGYEEEFCYEIGDEVTNQRGDTYLPEGEQILAIKVIETKQDNCEVIDETVYCNPHTCAEKARERLGMEDICDVTDEGQMARNVPGGCGHPPCEHPARRNGDSDNGNSNGNGSGRANNRGRGSR